MQQQQSQNKLKDIVFNWVVICAWLAFVSWLVQAATNALLKDLSVGIFVEYTTAALCVFALAFLVVTLAALARIGRGNDQQQIMQGIVQGMVLQKMLNDQVVKDPSFKN
jgi:hypothetical protein